MVLQKPSTVCPICKKGKQFRFVRDFIRSQIRYSLYECADCLVQFWLPLKTVENIWYEDNNPYKVRDLAKSKISRGYHKNFLKTYKIFPSGIKILDLGCGSGEFIAELEKRGCEVWGVDFDRDAIDIAKNRFGLKNVFALPFEKFFEKQDLPKFDIITFFEVIEHLADPNAFIEKTKTLLKEDGKIVLSTPCRERVLSNLNSWDFPPHHFTRWNKEAVARLFLRYGFKIFRISYVEQCRIISESILGKLKTGLVAKSISESRSAGKTLIIPKAIYVLGRVKMMLGKIPACFLLLFLKIFNHKDGIMLIELVSARRKIAFLIPTLSIGGGERVVSELSLNLSNSIGKIIILFKNQVSYHYKGKLFFLDIPFENSFFLKIYYFFIGIFRLEKIIKKENPDCVISFGVPAGIMNILTNKKTLLRVDNMVSISHKLFYRFLIKFFYRRASGVICVSKKSAKELTSNYGIKSEKIKMIYNPLNINEIQNLAKETPDSEYQEIFNKPTIITVGRLTKQKSQLHLIRSFATVKDTIKDAQLLIIGVGELEKELKQLTKDLGIENDVYFLGWQKNPFKFLSKSNVFVLSSLWEGLPYVLLEAMACGLPVISVDCESGPREILAPKTDIDQKAKDIEYEEFGILTPAFDDKNSNFSTESEKFLAKAMIKILTDKNLAVEFSQKSKQRASDFDIKNIIKEWDFLENQAV